MSNKMRDEFEEWAAEEAEVRGVGTLLGLMKDEHHDRYSMIWTQTAWVAWQASRAALVVELPKPWQTNVGAMLTPNGVRFAIESAGLKVTP
ncbi:hypothetical protein [Pseudomonas sp. S2_E02]|jgi:hypothetical protein